ncbi:siroheme synthase CysG [Aestuariibacter halophilus]|uniref:Siroheme synthase n=1 Tax=Fluctibacter halophilus TaxID=226011 RepID=A0ABS8GFG3_9ALTE|nr:siroheme synthase CysG [Aestuariibacter halophilus]MCC2617941.1 siroheme synthase CysG [Aestuariibacter halophilus]
MRYFPLFIDTQHLHCLVVGGGEVAARKLELLANTEAAITVVTREACPTVQKMAEEGRITLHLRPFEDSDIVAARVIFVATNDGELNGHIQSLGTAEGALVNVVDDVKRCNFITPSIVNRGPVTIAMASGGVAPVLLRYLRQKLEAWIPQRIARLGEFAERFRDQVKGRFNTVTQRRYFWEEVFDGPIAEAILQGNDAQAEQAMLDKLNSERPEQPGEVYLVGAGPGDPELLTFRALRLMQKADVVIYDRLVSPEILAMVRRDAEKHYVGKAKSNHTLPQQDINALLVKEAKAGKRVVRLKGGDPFIFGRGGEELETLVEHQVRFQVVPGITAASGAASYAGIPLTHRDHAQSVVFATGHLRDNSIDLDWPALVQTGQTLVFYMGLTGLPIICEQLVKHGMSAQTPIAMIANATTAQQRVVTGNLNTICAKAEAANIQPPALIVIGSVVSLHDSLNWFHPAPEALA